jgi:hypothetical protein
MTSRGAAEDLGVVSTDPTPATPSALDAYKHVFQSRRAGYRLSLRRRRVIHDPDGWKDDEVPLTSEGNRLDVVVFEDNFFKTNDDELADAIRHPKQVHLYGIGNEYWDYREMQGQQRKQRVDEIRAQLAADPALAAAVLTPTDKKDWDVAPTVAPKKPSSTSTVEMTEEELERLTAPTK